MRGKSICLLALALIGFPVLADPILSVKLAATTPLGDYRCYVHDKISQRWYSEMKKNDKGSLRYGTVKIRFKFCLLLPADRLDPAAFIPFDSK